MHRTTLPRSYPIAQRLHPGYRGSCSPSRSGPTPPYRARCWRTCRPGRHRGPSISDSPAWTRSCPIMTRRDVAGQGDVVPVGHDGCPRQVEQSTGPGVQHDRVPGREHSVKMPAAEWPSHVVQAKEPDSRDRRRGYHPSSSSLGVPEPSGGSARCAGCDDVAPRALA